MRARIITPEVKFNTLGWPWLGIINGKIKLVIPWHEGAPTSMVLESHIVSTYLLKQFFFFFLISNKFYWYHKRDTLLQRECTGGQQKLQESRKEENDWFRKVANQSNKVLKKKSLRSSMDLSLSSKHLLFISLQRHHIKQWGTINHIWPFLWWPSLSCQQARSPKTDCDITQLTPNKPKTIDQKSIATE